MSAPYVIRPYQPADLDQVRALDARVGPYRPEDQPEVEAMFARAAQARRDGYRWVALEPPAADPPIEEGYRAFWVAGTPAGDIVGIIGVARFGELTDGLGGLPEMEEWLRRDHVAELLHLRVETEWRRQGIGSALCRTVIAWARDQGFRVLVLNTSSPQTPALALYLSLGFRIVGRSYLDRYELVWHELAL
jgi:ribosomal protein S18 acetylase RimI-like enzyme